MSSAGDEERTAASGEQIRPPVQEGRDAELASLQLQISQLAVYPMDNQGKNIAQGKPTSSKDVYQDNRYGSSPDKAVDGDLKVKSFPSIYHSACHKDPWWQVDLQGVHNIAKIVYYNRADCCQWRARPLKLQFMDVNKKVLWTGEEFGSSASEQTFAFGDADLTIGQPR